MVYPQCHSLGVCFSILRRSAVYFFFFQAEVGIRVGHVTGVQTCALPISLLVAQLRNQQGQEAILRFLNELFLLLIFNQPPVRSEERRVGKETRDGMWTDTHTARTA